ncbi:MAG: polyribonucleotide nucleotidyltransferase [Candidatus Woesearchaeota archaeon]
MNETIVFTEVGGKKIEIKTGGFAQQANGSVFVQMGETVVMANATVSAQEREDLDYFPLMVEYEEKMYAAGKILGSRFIKREGKPSEDAILTGRLIDRSIRPLFDNNIRRDVQVVVTVLSIDQENDPDVLSVLAASSALAISDIPFEGPACVIRVAKVNGKMLVNPTVSERKGSEFESMVSVANGKITMIETEGNEAADEDLKKAFDISVKEAEYLNKLQEELVKKVGKKKFDIPVKEENKELKNKIEEIAGKKLEEAIYNKDEVKKSILDVKKEILDSLNEDEDKSLASDYFDKLNKKIIRNNILEKGKRPDGRKLDEIRKIDIETGVLPRTHGSAMFRRGMTQALTITTLGSTADAQILDTMELDTQKRYMHHYNFPPYSVGEARPMRGAGRREIGHGALAEKALVPVLPDKEIFPYTIRLVTEILSSNGSTSMASTCGSTLSLMDAGVPIKAPVAGISIGLVTSEDLKRYTLLTDLIGQEDFCGDMDFKVAGTRRGITAIQMDTKLKGVDKEILKEGLDKAKKARFDILDIMQKALSAPRPELSKYAPRIEIFKIDPEKIRDVIGSQGKVINSIIGDSGVEIDIEDDGTITVCSTNPEENKKAVDKIKAIVKDVEVGEVFEGKVTRILNFGAFVEIAPGKEGMIHVSKIADNFVKDINKVVKIGDTLKVKVAEIDKEGRINLVRDKK